jgi:cell division septum initiation protein DivIVA
MAHKKDKTEFEIIDVPQEASKAGTENMKIKEGAEQELEAANTVTFKRVMRGFNPSEVNEYIEVLTANLANAQLVFDAQSAELKSNIAFASRERDKLKEELAATQDKMEAYEQKCAECEEIKEELDDLREKNANLREQVNSLFSKLELCKNLAAENREIKNKAAEIDIERKHMAEQKALLAAEIAELREINTQQAYNFAEQKKDIETQYLNDSLRRAELMQVHTYHIRKSSELLDEVNKQFKLAKKSLEEMETKQ